MITPQPSLESAPRSSRELRRTIVAIRRSGACEPVPQPLPRYGPERESPKARLARDIASTRIHLRTSLSFPLAQELLDRLVNAFFVFNFRQQERIVPVAKAAVQIPQKLAAAVRAFDLAVTKQIHHGQQTFAQKLKRLFIIFAPVVAIGEL